MFRSYFKTAWKNLQKNKILSFINIGGLSVGIASAILLLSYVTFQFSFDNFHAKKKDIYRVGLDLYENNKLIFQSAENYSGLAPALKRDFPEIEAVGRLYNMGYKNNCVFTYNNNSFRETKFMYADPSIFNIFSFPFLQGDRSTALSQPYTAVISESLSKKIFGNDNPVGKSIKMDDDDRNSELCQVTGVYDDVPANSHIQFNILISFSTLDHRRNGLMNYENNWGRKDFYTYVLLRPNTDAKLLEAKFPAFLKKYNPGENSNNTESVLQLQPLEKIHLTSNRIDEPETTGNQKAVSFLIIIAFFIVTIAWVNFINMTTSGSVNRAKEIGIRKVLGSRRPELIKQFLVESLVINTIGFCIALCIVFSMNSVLHTFFQFDFTMSGFLENKYGLIFMAFMTAGTFFSALYPAFVLSAFKPVSVLKGKIKAAGTGVMLRKSLVVFQFALSIFLIIGTIIVSEQVHFMLNKDLGMNTSQLIVLDRPGKWDSARAMHNTYVQRFKETVKNNSAIESVGMSDELPGKEIRNPGNYLMKNATNTSPFPINTISIDENLLHVLGIRLLAGRNFSDQFKTDKNALIITGSAAALLGFKSPQDAVGKELISENTNYPIVGVTNDFNQMSLEKEAGPIVFQFNNSDAREFEYYLVKIKAANARQAIQYIQRSWNTAFPGNPFNFSFLDEYFNRQYKNEIQFEMLFGTFASIAIIISCIGLFSLLAFMIEQRIKEIGVRKVLGAGIRDIVLLLSKDFIRLVLIANLVAWPLAWILMNSWLKDFPYRIHISVIVFITSAAIALLIAIATISIQAVKAAIANPIKNLRTE